MQDLIEELSAIEAQKADLEARIAAAKEEAKAGIVEKIRAVIMDSGFQADEILSMVATAAPAKPARVFPVWAMKSNPTGSTYTRGVLPGWLKHAMRAAGMDPGSAEDRGKFKAEHMVQV